MTVLPIFKLCGFFSTQKFFGLLANNHSQITNFQFNRSTFVFLLWIKIFGFSIIIVKKIRSHTSYFFSLILQEKETKLVDTNAGFFIEETEGGESSSQMAEPLPAPVLEPDRPEVRFFYQN